MCIKFFLVHRRKNARKNTRGEGESGREERIKENRMLIRMMKEEKRLKERKRTQRNGLEATWGEGERERKERIRENGTLVSKRQS